MYPHLKTWRPVLMMATLVATSVLATSTVTVDAGETLSEIAIEHDVRLADLVEWNEIDDPDRIRAGTRLMLAAPAGAAPGSSSQHVVTAGDTLSAIARRFGVTVAHLVDANGLADPDRIIEGQTLSLSATPTTTAATPTTSATPARTHTVAPGESLSVIAETYGVKTGVLARDNGISDPNLIVAGTVLTIGAAAPSTSASEPESETEADPVTTTTTVTTTTAASAASSAAAVPPAETVFLVPLFEKWSRIYSVPQELLEAIAWHESNWQADAVGADGHLGVTQLNPATVELIESGLIGRDLDPLDPEDGVQLGARYLRYVLDRASGEREAIAAWSQGLESVNANGVSDAGAAYVAAIEDIRRLRS